MMKNWGDNGLTPTQRLLRCFAELDTTKIKNTDRSQLISSIQADYGLTLEEATMLIAEKEADVTMGKWGSMKYGSTQKETITKQQRGELSGGGSPAGVGSPSSPGSTLSKDLLVDPISSELMVDPAILPCGHSFSHKTISQWLQKNKKCPLCNQPASEEQLKPNFALANVVNHFMASTNETGDDDNGEGGSTKEKGKKKKKKSKKKSTMEIKFYSKKEKSKLIQRANKGEKKSSSDVKSIPLLLYEGWGSDEESAIPVSVSDGLDLERSARRQMKSSPDLGLGARKQRGGSEPKPKGITSPPPPRRQAQMVSRVVVRSKPIGLKFEDSGDSSSAEEDLSDSSDGYGSEKEDEYLAWAQQQGDLPSGRDLALTLHAEFPQVNSEGRHSLLMVASIKAPIKNIASDAPKKDELPMKGSSSVITRPPPGEECRPPVAIVAVIDRSSSMRGDKMALVKTALRFLVQQLSGDDYVGIVSYDGSVCTETKIVQLSGKGKDKVISAIDNIDTGFMTNLSGGLLTGLKLFKRLPSNTNLVTSLLLFTDGLANKGIINRRELIQSTEDLLGKLKARKGISPTLFTFGFGSAPDAQTLGQIAETSNGLYYAIENAEGIPVAFVDCLGGLLSVCAEEITLELETLNNVYIEKIYLKPGNKSTLKESRYSVDLGDIYFEEMRDVVFSVSVPSVPATEKMPILKATVSYICLPSRTLHRVTSEVAIGRPSVMHMPFEEQQPNLIVDKQHNRILAVEAIRKSIEKMNKGNYIKAEKVLQKTIEKINRSATRHDYLSKCLAESLFECLKRTRASKQSKGKDNNTSFQNSLVVTHSRQRSTHTSTTYRTRNKSKAISTFKIDGEFKKGSKDNREMRKSKSQVDSPQVRPVKKRPGHVSSNSDGKIKYNPLELVGEEKVKYVIEQARGLYEKIKLLYSLLEGRCTSSSCPKMCAGNKYEFLWKDERTGKISPLSAPGYTGQLFEWSMKEFDRSEKEFGASSVNQRMPAEKAFLATIKNVMRRLFRVYAHIFYHHVSAFEGMGELPLLRESFSQFISFVRRFSLADEVDLLPMKTLIDTLNLG